MARKILSITLGTLIVTGGGMAARASVPDVTPPHTAVTLHAGGVGAGHSTEDDSGWQ